MTANVSPPNITVLDHGSVNGIHWATAKAPLYGAVNGYVLIPEGHIWHGLDYDEIPVDVHGGLTYGSLDGWIGFDTLHAGDLWAGEEDFCLADPYDCTRWTLEKVAKETRRLARQVAEATA